MELVYLWVERYRNIKKQGFNFSPKFNCHYDGKTLTINENIDENDNKKYIENFFGNNINVTAIVGKNGSGKSSILSFLNERTYTTIDNYESDFKDTIITNKITLLYDDLKKKLLYVQNF